MPQRPQAGAAAQSQHQEGLRGAGGMAQNAGGDRVPGQSGQELIPAPPGMNGAGDAEFHFMAVPPDGDGLVGRLTGFEMTQVGPGHKTKNWQDRGPLEQGRGSCQPHFLTIQIFR